MFKTCGSELFVESSGCFITSLVGFHMYTYVYIKKIYLCVYVNFIYIYIHID